MMPVETHVENNRLSREEACNLVHVVDADDMPHFLKILERVTVQNLDWAVTLGIQQLERDRKDFLERFKIGDPTHTPAEMFYYLQARHSMDHAIQCAVNALGDLEVVSFHLRQWCHTHQIKPEQLDLTKEFLQRQKAANQRLRQLFTLDIYRRIAELKSSPQFMDKFVHKLGPDLPSSAALYNEVIMPKAWETFVDFKDHIGAVNAQVCAVTGADPNRKHPHPFYHQF